MFSFLFRRITGLIGVLALLLIATFLIIQLVPGDPARRVAGMEASSESVERLREEMGLNKPLLVQFTDYIKGVLQFNFGKSFLTGEPVNKIISNRFPHTAKLTVIAVLLSVIIYVPMGIIVGVLTREGRNRKLYAVFTGITSVLTSIPGFLIGVLLVAIFAIWLRLLPVAGAEHWYSVILPAIAASTSFGCILARAARSETITVFAQDYIRIAISKRLPARLLYFRHVLPNTLTATLTITGIAIVNLLGGTVIVENVFAWPGLGTVVVASVRALDYPVIQGVVFFLGFIAVITTATIDILVTIFDPRSIIKEG